jgi:hypothetical protein
MRNKSVNKRMTFLENVLTHKICDNSAKTHGEKFRTSARKLITENSLWGIRMFENLCQIPMKHLF